MQEPPPARPTGPGNRAIYLAMLLSPIIGLILCGNAIGFAIWEANPEMRIPAAFRLDASGTSSGHLLPEHALLSSNQLYLKSGDIDLDVSIDGKIKADDYSEGRFDKPGRPWLVVSLYFMAYAGLLQRWKLYEVFRRKRAAIKLTVSATKAISLGAVLCYAGSGHHFAATLLLFSLPYAGIGYPAYTRWEALRAQLHRD